MKLLAIDTSTSRASVALKIGEEIHLLEEDVLQRHAEWVLPAVAKLLADAEVTLSSLNGLVFGQGPGSFTGLRIACSIVKGLAVGANLAVYPVCGLDAIAYQVQFKGQVIAMIDARMQAWYWALYQDGERGSEPLVSAPSDLCCPDEGPVVLAGIGFEGLIASLPQSLRSRLTETHIVYPSAAALIKLVSEKNITPVSPEEARPLYIRQEVTHG